MIHTTNERAIWLENLKVGDPVGVLDTRAGECSLGNVKSTVSSDPEYQFCIAVPRGLDSYFERDGGASNFYQMVPVTPEIEELCQATQDWCTLKSLCYREDLNGQLTPDQLRRMVAIVKEKK